MSLDLKTKERIRTGARGYLTLLISYTILRFPIGILVLAFFTKRSTESIAFAMRYGDAVVYFPFQMILKFGFLLEHKEWFGYAMIGYYIAVVFAFLLLMVCGVFKWVWNTLKVLSGSN